MATLTLTKNYADATILYESDFNDFLNEIETLFNVTKLNDDNINSASLTGTTILKPATVTTALLASNAVTTAKIALNTVVAANINALAVTTAKITDGTLTGSRFSSTAVTAAKIVDGTLVYPKVVSNSATSTPIVTLVTIPYSTSSPTVVGELSKSITTTGNSVEIRVSTASLGGNANTVINAQIALNVDSATPELPTIQIYRDATLIQTSVLNMVHTGITGFDAFPITMGPFIDSPGAGTFAYTVKAYYVTGTVAANNVTFHGGKLFVREM